MKATILTATLLSSLFVAAVASAQSGPYAIRSTNNGTPAVYHHASTYEEGVLRGWADLWRGVGDYNYNTSLANINHQQAYSQALDNSVKKVDTFFARRALNRQARESERAGRPSAEDIARFAKERVPQRLAGHEYHEALGKVNWPAVLSGADFAAERDAIDGLVAGRTVENSGLGSRNQRQIKHVAGAMTAKLKSRIGDYGTQEYLAGKGFLNRLEREAHFQLGLGGALTLK